MKRKMVDQLSSNIAVSVLLVAVVFIPLPLFASKLDHIPQVQVAALTLSPQEDTHVLLHCQTPVFPAPPSYPICAGTVSFYGPNGTTLISSHTFSVPPGAVNTVTFLGSSIPPTLLDSTGHVDIITVVNPTPSTPATCPSLKDVPILSWLFTSVQGVNHTDGLSEFVIFITPKLVYPCED